MDVVMTDVHMLDNSASSSSALSEAAAEGDAEALACELAQYLNRFSAELAFSSQSSQELLDALR